MDSNYNSRPFAMSIVIRLVGLLCRLVITTHVPPRGASSSIWEFRPELWIITTPAPLRGILTLCLLAPQSGLQLPPLHEGHPFRPWFWSAQRFKNYLQPGRNRTTSFGVALCSNSGRVNTGYRKEEIPRIYGRFVGTYSSLLSDSC